MRDIELLSLLSKNSENIFGDLESITNPRHLFNHAINVSF